MKVTKAFWLSCVLVLVFAFAPKAQEASIKLGAPEIGLNQYFTITMNFYVFHITKL